MTTPEIVPTESAVPPHIRAAIAAGHVGQVTIFCDNCGYEETADYTGETKEIRFEAAREYLAEHKGWTVTADADLCPGVCAEPAESSSPVEVTSA
jgi:hypothetical protein